MPDYKSIMYAELFNSVTDAIQILQNAQIETEKIFMVHENAKVTKLRRIDSPQNQENLHKE